MRLAEVFRRVGRIPLNLIPDDMAVRVLRGPHRGLRWYPSSGVHSFWIGGYEPPVLRAFVEHVGPGSVVADVGANVGYYTLIASRLVGPTGKVVAFEPLPRNLLYLRSHISVNGLNNVHVVEGAVSDQSGELSFNARTNPAMGFLSETGNFRVATMALDAVWRQLALPPPNLIKIDVEGGEAAVLRGAQSLLATHPALLLSTHGSANHEICLGVLSSRGYRTFDLLRDGSADGMYEVLARP